MGRVRHGEEAGDRMRVRLDARRDLGTGMES